MIQNDQELAVVREQAERVERALLSLRHDVLPKSEQRFLLMAEAYADELLKLRAQINEYLGVNAILEAQASVTIRLQGLGLELGETAGSLLTRTLDTFRRGLQSIVQTSEGEKLRGRPKRWIEHLCDLPLLEVRPGSVEVLLGFPDESHLFEHESIEVLKSNLRALFDGLAWTAGEDAMDLKKAIANDDVRHTVLGVIRNLMPPPKGPLEALTFGGRWVGYKQPMRITSQLREKVDEQIKQLAMSQEYTEIRGVIREIDLDAGKFVLRERLDEGAPLTCEYGPESEATVKACLDERVVLTGSLQISRKNKTERMEVESIAPDLSDLDASADAVAAMEQ